MPLSYVQSPIGILEIHIQDESLIAIKKSNHKNEHIQQDRTTVGVIGQLREYLSGQRVTFDLPVRSQGTPFQQAVWEALANIPAGQTRTYGQVAAMIGKPRAARAVGQALNKNPVCIVVPCHRVTAVNGLGGYAYGKRRRNGC